MKRTLAVACLLPGLLLGPALAMAGSDSDSDSRSKSDSDADRAHPKEWVKDSAITTKIKTKLAAEHITSLGRIHVDTDKSGVVWLTGYTRTQEARDKAVAIARATEGVTSVKNELTVRKDD